MSNKMIVFDMDGTIADLYSVPNWLDKLRAEDPAPYLDAEPMWDMGKLADVLRRLVDHGWQVRVISWLSKDSSEEYKTAVREAKLAWLKKYNFPYHSAHLVAYGTTKADCVRRIATAAILVDDNQKVRNGWSLGETIDPTDGDLLEKLENLVEG